jgi:hypothetical protein
MFVKGPRADPFYANCIKQTSSLRSVTLHRDSRLDTTLLFREIFIHLDKPQQPSLPQYRPKFCESGIRHHTTSKVIIQSIHSIKLMVIGTAFAVFMSLVPSTVVRCLKITRQKSFLSRFAFPIGLALFHTCMMSSSAEGAY